jgi:hypothetical protein
LPYGPGFCVFKKNLNIMKVKTMVTTIPTASVTKNPAYPQPPSNEEPNHSQGATLRKINPENIEMNAEMAKESTNKPRIFNVFMEVHQKMIA